MRKFYLIILPVILQFFFYNYIVAQSVLNPTDPIVEYDASNPPQQPPFNQIGKWVRTKSMSWNSDSYKAYIYKGYAFRLKFPKTYNSTANDGKIYPVTIFFHGLGEAGPVTDNETQLFHGGKQYMTEVDNGNYDGYVLFMQSQGFFGPSQYQSIIEIINYMVSNNKLDPFAISVAGLSAGGQAAWDMIINYPTYVAASAPMSSVSAAYTDQSTINKVKFSPIWNFQGGLDGSPSPYTSQQVDDAMVAAGGDYKYTVYPNSGHNTWDSAFAEPDYFPFMLRAYSSNPWALFGKTGFCDAGSVDVTIGVDPGFDGYQWRKDASVISGAVSNTIHVTDLGTYSARVLRGSVWSEWSRIPVKVQITPPTVAPPITVSGAMSNVIPDGGGKNYVNLEIPDKGYTSYKWKKVGSDSVISTQRIYTATLPGKYIVAVTEKFGCSSVYSQPFSVVNSNGLNPPPPATNVTANTVSSTEISLSWENNPKPAYNETAFEIYRSTSQDGTYNFIGSVGADILNYTDNQLSPGITYFYKVRAVDTTAASEMSNFTVALTQKDSIPPTAPGNLDVKYTTNSSIKLRWKPATDNVGVLKYELYVNGTKKYSTSDTEFIINALHTATNYTFYVKAIDSSGNASPQSDLANAPAVLNGLIAKYYEGNWASMPDFSVLKPLATTFVPNTDITSAARQSQFAYLWEGFINIPVNGTYTFQTTSDDGSILWLNAYDPSKAPLVNNDGSRSSSQSSSGRIVLKKGIYPISIAYFQVSGPKLMRVSWRCAQLYGDSKIHPVEDKYYRSNYNAPDSAPVKPSNLIATALSYKKIKLAWDDASNNETGFQVYRSLLSSSGYSIVYTSGPNIKQFTDSSLKANTRYYYKINSVNDYGTSDFTAVSSDRTAALPPPPDPPTGLSALALSSSSIKLTWQDVDTDEVNYEVYRSVTNTTNFKLAATLPANSATFTDTSLYGNITYYYRVNAVNLNSSSKNQTPVKATTKNSSPVINNKFSQTAVHYGIATTVNFSATDSDGDVVTLNAVNLPAFANFTNTGNGTSSITFNPSAAQQGTYNNLRIFAKDPQGAADTMIFQLVVNDNFSPVIDSIADYSINEGDVLQIPLTANDQNAGNILKWSVANAPKNFSFSNVSGATTILKLNPQYTTAGIYSVSVTVNDGNGGIVTRQFQLTVSDYDPNQTVYIRFKDQDVIGAPWNNVTSVNSSNFKDNLGRTSTIGLNMQSGWFSTWHEGPQTGNNSGVYPDAVLKDYYYFGIFGGPETVTNKITGLDTSKLYNISFYGGSNFSQQPNNGTTIFSIGSQSIPINVQNNTTNTADFTNMKPATDGTVTFTLSKGANTPAGYINAIVIKYTYQDTLKPAAPTTLVAEAVSGSVQLTWKDVAYNETGYQLLRSNTINGVYRICASLPANATVYNDTSVIGNTQYFYKARALNSTGFSGTSNIDSVITLNKAPQINAIADVILKSNQQQIVQVIAKDDPSDIITLTAANLPSFVTFIDNGNGSGTFTVKPNGTIGTFNNVTVIAKDKSDSSASTSFNISVTDLNVSSVYINFSDGTLAHGYWNNFTSAPNANATLSNLKDDNNAITSISLKLVNGFQGRFSDGAQPGNGQAIYSETVLKSGEYESSTKTDSILIAGLSSAKKYNFVFFNSHDDGLNGATNFGINAQTVSLNASYNINKTVQINGIAPNAGGQVYIKVSKNSTANFAYLNSLVIQSYDSDQAILSPADLRVSKVTRNSVGLQWSDRSYNETGFEIWRAADSSLNYALVKTVPPDITSYTDSNLYSNKTYYYTVRSITGTTQSDYSNTVAATTYAQAVYVNFTYKNDAPTPWNNTDALPEQGDEFNNLFDDNGIPSNISMQVTGVFAGLYSAGINTGNNSGIYPDNVLIDSYGLFPGQNASLKISGLNLTRKYDFTFLASSQASGDVNVAYIINNSRVVLNASANTNGTVTIYNVLPDDNGEINITLGPASQTSQFGLINSMVVQEYEPSTQTIPAPGQANKVFAGSNNNSLKAGNGESLTIYKVYPNPFKNTFNLSFTLQKLSDVQVDIFNMNGVQIYQQRFKNLFGGSNTLSITPERSIADGMYVIKITDINSKKSAALKVLKQ